ncbi:response regulator [Dolichospermum sp. ST_con]|nr:response regulator [Dolichospermum sp. ST_con]MDD1419213.1 response regulator [Dolichospermum sp. ST_sed1]MDD1425572.1 response regulator [Dolichospermum sp. ST_sed9]MDD1432207.1 response regulator [Dolichospermum sp. ST_sed6]MDD1436041.1 response regulator [Dolichospermum sp. ST_sed10]MDD1441914.1 response regulator [Dolichospermum sp. ST_sed3]MDD1444756.1 response regulator [Dolichospermum sp. ST_sed8]MDD1454846.1 response regulator [Dolichospermum sp. ST_sed7]MDD1461734.1 response reg
MGIAKILIVEDEVIVARNIASQLNQLGYIVTGKVSSGQAAISQAADNKPDLILMDIVIKGDMDGITTANHIHEQLDIPIIFLTAYGDENTLERAKVTQPFGYIVKPFTIRDLRIAIEIALVKHKLECELRESRDQLATLLNSMSDAVVATNEQGIITFINPAAEKITGWQEIEALGKNISEIINMVDEVTGEMIENPVTKVLRQKQSLLLREVAFLITKNSTKLPVANSASLLMRRPHEISGVVLVLWDLSERRQREYLEQSLKKEQELNHLKSLFISTVSHEFRNPLSVIQTAVELIEIQGDNLTEIKRKKYLTRIYGAVESMEKLMKDVLFVGKAEAGMLTCNPEPINLEKFCQELIEDFELIEDNRHEIVFTCNSQNTNAVMDGGLLYHLFINLISNAIKYSPANAKVYFELSCDHIAKLATFKIQDQGIGIPQNDQNKIFNSFYRASNVELIQGDGLGLVIVKRCVDAHKGQINMVSKINVGTTFTISLPLHSRSQE